MQAVGDADEALEYRQSNPQPEQQKKCHEGDVCVDDETWRDGARKAYDWAGNGFEDTVENILFPSRARKQGENALPDQRIPGDFDHDPQN